MATKSDDIRARLLSVFRVEAEEHLQTITANLLALEREPPPAEVRQVVEATFRAVHTLKGAARSVSLMDAEAVCQALESILSRITRDQLRLTRRVLDHLHEGVDGVARVLAGGEASTGVRELVSRLERAAAGPGGEVAEPVPTAGPEPVQAPPPPEAPTASVAPGLLPEETIRVSAAKLDAALLQAEQLLLPKLYVAQAHEDVRAVLDALMHCRVELNRTWAACRLAGNGHGAGLPANIDSELRALENQIRQMLQGLARRQQRTSTLIDGLQDEMRRLRLMPASTILDLFPRMVRDLARQQGKEIEWVAQGASLEVDRRVLEAMKDPLIHLVRNAIGHGIESPETRTAAGKPPRGKVGVTFAFLEGERVEIRVEDDGGGIDQARLRAAAVRARVLTSEAAESLTDEAALELIYRSGVSTNPVITDVSGHGLGLAIVKERVERLKGEIHVETWTRAGTTVRMVLPATIATFHGLLVRAGGQRLLLPTEAVERAIRVRQSEIERVEGREMIRWDGRLLPVAPLSRLLGLPEREEKPDPASYQFCVAVRSGEERLGLLVEEVVGDREVLVREFRPPLVRVRNVAAAGFLGMGQFIMILRPADLFRSARLTPRAPVARPALEDRGRQPVILVVDDSITTRTMEKNLLEAAGFQVRVAVDGVDAWTALKSASFDLVLSDVDMPRMDGFELTARIRADRKLADLPVVLVTAMESRENKERGIDMGANAYIIKSSFDQSNLLEIIRRLV